MVRLHFEPLDEETGAMIIAGTIFLLDVIIVYLFFLFPATAEDKPTLFFPPDTHKFGTDYIKCEVIVCCSQRGGP